MTVNKLIMHRSSQGYSCPSSSSCLPSSLICDGTPDCLHGEDEMCCHDNVTCCTSDVTACTCDDVTEFTCSKTGQCVRGNARCDGRGDCTDRSDEYSCAMEACPEGSFRCNRWDTLWNCKELCVRMISWYIKFVLWDFACTLKFCSTCNCYSLCWVP